MPRIRFCATANQSSGWQRGVFDADADGGSGRRERGESQSQRRGRWTGAGAGRLLPRRPAEVRGRSGVACKGCPAGVGTVTYPGSLAGWVALGLRGRPTGTGAGDRRRRRRRRQLPSTRAVVCYETVNKRPRWPIDSPPVCVSVCPDPGYVAPCHRRIKQNKTVR